MVVEGKPEKLGKGDLVTVNLGTEDGITEEDYFETVASSKGVELTGKTTKEIQVVKVLNDHLSLCLIVENGLDVKKGSKVKKVE